MPDRINTHLVATRRIPLLILTTALWLATSLPGLGDRLFIVLTVRPQIYETLVLLGLPIVLMYSSSTFRTNEAELRRSHPLIFWGTVAFASIPFFLVLVFLMVVTLSTFSR